MKSKSRRATRPLAVSRNHLDPVCLALPTVIRRRRLKLGLTVREVARRSRLSPQAILRLEKSQRVPGVDTLARVGLALETSASILLRRAESRAQG
jgi:transcriptional regulator with XRE-family HTH domain